MKRENQSVFSIDVNSLLAILTKYPFNPILATIIVIGLLGIYGFNQYHAAKEESVAVQSCQYTLLQYERLKLGMSLVEVQAILNAGIETQRSMANRVFMWKNHDGCYILATFTDGKLTDKKTQKNLSS